MPDAATIARTARRNAGLTQRALAELLGVTQPVVARLERAGSNPTLATLQHIAAATGHTLKIELNRPSGIDETMIVADLALTPDERLERFEGLYEFAKAIGGTAFRGG
jgi:transcriptional regulator with XRE-family HTH domain